MIDAIESGDDDAQIKALKAMMDSGLFSTNAPGVDTKKLYMGTVGPSARKRAGKESEKDTGRIDPATGIHYLKFGNDNVFAKKIHELIETHGGSLGKSSFNLLGDKTGKKRMNPDMCRWYNQILDIKKKDEILFWVVLVNRYSNWYIEQIREP